MAQKKTIKKRTINLLPNKGDGLIDQFLSWALSVGRLLIIITETLALTVFVYRFTLDRQIIDLHDNIKIESAIVKGFETNEKLFRNIQSRLTFAKEYDATKSNTITLTKDILAIGSNKVTFRTLLVKNDGIDIEIQAPSARLLAQFTDELKQHPEITGLTVNRVENKTSGGVVIVGLSAERKTKLTENPSTTGNEENQEIGTAKTGI
ncbi:MAG TPA: hypothetical protein VLF20_03740 [Patescibacteria group bacterium]|nr:hypothetical protein [Patescibacteria group bacterium]